MDVRLFGVMKNWADVFNDTLVSEISLAVVIFLKFREPQWVPL